MNRLLKNLAVRNKLSVLGGVAIASYVIIASVGLFAMGAVSRQSTAMSHSRLMTHAVSVAYENWILDDDQSNMYAALVALNDPTQQALAETTWGQAVAGYRER